MAGKDLRFLLFWVLSCALILVWIWVPWLYRVDLLDPWLSRLSFISAAIWFIVLCWAAYQLGHQLVGITRAEDVPKTQPSQPYLNFVLFYLTCDDIVPEALEFCRRQRYPRLRVYICDDSSDPEQIAKVDSHAARLGVEVVRRNAGPCLKAANLNYAFNTVCREDDDWIVIADADQQLQDEEYITKLAAFIASLSEGKSSSLAYVQAKNWSDHRSESPNVTLFQRAAGLEIDLFYTADLPSRQTFGIVPFLGHGGAVSVRALRDIKGFPLGVSEDFLFTMAVFNKGKAGLYASHIASMESYPRDFGSFVIRLRKFAGGTAELFKSGLYRQFVWGPSTLVQTVDLTMLLAWYGLILLIFPNAYLSAYVCYRLSEVQVPAVHPFLPYLFVTFFLAGLVAIRRPASGFFEALNFWFWSVAIYTSTLPVAGWSFLKHLGPSKAVFERTPKADALTPRLGLLRVLMAALGLITLTLACMWRSPFSWVLGAHGVAYLFFPFYFYVHKTNFGGWLARCAIYIPGGLMLAALVAMWRWAKWSK